MRGLAEFPTLSCEGFSGLAPVNWRGPEPDRMQPSVAPTSAATRSAQFVELEEAEQLG